MIALIDGDMAIYAAAFSNQITIDLGDGLGNEPIVNEAEAVRNVIRLIKEWTRAAGCSREIVCLSAVKSDSFRHRLWPTYKAGRGEKPSAYAAVRNAVELEFEVYQEVGLEADDLMGIAGTSEAAQTVIVSKDKDMKTVPALVFNPTHDRKPVRIRPAVADQMWMKQTMTGDAIDCYPGIPGVGEVKAQAILTAPHRLRSIHTGKKRKWVKGEPCSLWQSMLDYAAKAGKTEEDVILMAQLSRILRSGDFNKETRTVKLWRPGKHEELKL
jgi:5'-3' exonuclease